MAHSFWFMGVSAITGVLGLIGAIVLFNRSRSTATILFLGGSAAQAVIPFTSWLASHNMPMYFGVITLANICAAVGLLWYAIKLPKTAAPAPASDGNPFFK